MIQVPLVDAAGNFSCSGKSKRAVVNKPRGEHTKWEKVDALYRCCDRHQVKTEVREVFEECSINDNI